MGSDVRTVAGYMAAVRAVVFFITVASPLVIGGGYVAARGLWSIYSHQIVTFVHDTFGPAENRALILANREIILELRGDNRVLHQRPGLSFVDEPVRASAPTVRVVLVIERTELGAACVFLGGTSLFTGRDGIPRRGGDLAVVMQVGTSAARFEIEVGKPDDLPLGRATVYFAMNYECGGQFVPDRTYDMAFEHLAG